MNPEQPADTAQPAMEAPANNAQADNANNTAPNTPPPATDTNTPPAPAADQQLPADAPKDPAQPEYKIPDAYKDKAWASKIKSEEDLYKQIDNLQTLVGKKTVHGKPDFANPEAVEEFKTQMRPADVSAYEFADDSDAEGGLAGLNSQYAELLYDSGIPAEIGNEMIKKFNGIQEGVIAKMYDEGDFNKTLEASFGKDYGAVAGATAREIAATLTPEDKVLLETVPNKFLGLIYRLTSGMQQKYGAHESGAPASAPNASAPIDYDTQINTTRDKIASMSTQPHLAEEKAKLVTELGNLYVKKANSGNK